MSNNSRTHTHIHREREGGEVAKHIKTALVTKMLTHQDLWGK